MKEKNRIVKYFVSFILVGMFFQDIYASGTVTKFLGTSEAIGGAVKGVQQTPNSLMDAGKTISSYSDTFSPAGEIGGALSSIGEAAKPITDGLSGITDVTDAISNIGGAIDAISSLFGGSSSPSVTASVQGIISAIGKINHDLDGLFSATNLSTIQDNINRISALSSCFGLDFSVGLNGLCSNLGSLGIGGLGGAGSSNFLRCVGIDVSGLGNIGIDLSSLCSGVAAKRVNEALKNANSGSTFGGWSNAGGGSGTNPLNVPTTYGYNPLNVVSTFSTDIDALGNGTEKDKGTKVEEVKYQSGKTGQELYGKDGGVFASKGKKNPNSSDGRAWLQVDNTTLVLKDMAFKALGITDESASPLPKNIADAKNKENDVAKLRVASFIDLNDVANMLAGRASSSYKAIEADSIESYFSQEHERFSAMTEGEDIKKLYKMAEQYISMKYASKLFLASVEKHYGREPVYDTSQERLRYVSKELKDEYVMSSLVQMVINTDIKAQALKEKRLTKELLDITLERAYIKSSVFPAGVAEKEIDELLSAVDRAIE